MVIRILLGQKNVLARGAIAAVLSRAHDLRVVAEMSSTDEIPDVVQRERVHIAILDAKLPGSTPMIELCEKVIQHGGVLILTDPDREMGETGMCVSLARLAPKVGFVTTESSPEILIDGVRRAARGEPVLDSQVALAALTADQNPLTQREREVLCLAAEGLRVREIADRLYLSQGTIRNNLSRIMTKTDAQTRIAAIRNAREKGWI